MLRVYNFMEISWFVYCFIATKHSTVYCVVLGPSSFFISFPFLFALYQLISFLLIAVGLQQRQHKGHNGFRAGRERGARGVSNQLLFDGGIHWEEDKHCWPRLRCRLKVAVLLLLHFHFPATCCTCRLPLLWQLVVAVVVAVALN